MIHGRGLEIPESLAEAVRPDRASLVVYDMQAGIVRQLPNGMAVVAKVSRVLAAAREAGFRVFFLRHMSLPVEVAGVMQLRMAMAWQKVSRVEDVRPWFLRGSPGFDIIEELAPRPSEAIFDKIGFSAFEGTPLTTAMRDCGLNAVVLCGIAVEIGIEPTARHAIDLGFIPIVVEDACGYGDEAAAQHALEQLRFGGDAILTTVDSIIRSFERA
jgi:nicotinamidase-related amidase